MPRGDEATDDCGSGSGGSNRSLDAHALLPPPRVATSRVVHGRTSLSPNKDRKGSSLRSALGATTATSSMVLAFQGRKLMGCRLWETGYSSCGFHHEVALPSGHELKTSAARSSLAREHTGGSIMEFTYKCPRCLKEIALGGRKY